MRIIVTAIVAALTVAAVTAPAQPVPIEDIVRVAAGGEPFQGTLTILAPAFVRQGVTYAAWRRTYAISDGIVSLALVPNPASALYRVTWEQHKGRVQPESWHVPESAVPLKVADPIVAGPPLPPAVPELPPSRIGVGGAASGDVMIVLESGRSGWAKSAGGSSTVPQFVDQKALPGMVDGQNAVFRLEHEPKPVSSLMVFRNGLLQGVGEDFSLSGGIVTFRAVSMPQPGDQLVVSYRY